MSYSKIMAALAATAKVLPDHYITLFGQRKSGSQWADACIPMRPEFIATLFKDASMKQANGCTYFHVERVLRPMGTIGYTTLVQLFDHDDVTIVEGAHGLELRTCGVKKSADAWEANLIIGDENGVEVVFTLYPGPVTDRIPAEFWVGRKAGDIVDRKDINPNWAIKFPGAV